MNLDAIEPLNALGITLISASETQVSFRVPVLGNKNDKGTVFAGSQYSGLVICGWYLASQWAATQGLGEKVAIKDCQVTYPLPANSDLTVTARFQATPDKRPSGHYRVLIIVEGKDHDDNVTSELRADYRILQS